MSIRFQEVSREEAVRTLGAQRAWLASLAKALKPAPNGALTPEKLLSTNLIGGVTAGTAEV